MSAAEAPANGGGSAPVPQAAADGASSSASAPKRSFADVLEAANDLRRIDEILEKSGYNDVMTSSGGEGEEGGGGGGSASADLGAIEDLADSDDGDEPRVYDAGGGDDDLDDSGGDRDGSGRPAYTPATVSAISSLMKGGGMGGGGGEPSSSLFTIQEDDGPSGRSKYRNAALTQQDVSLMDRAAAMISVYKDFLSEDDDGGSEGAEEEKEGDGEEEDPSGDDDDDGADPPPSLDAYSKLRKEEIKVATLEKFCKDEGVGDGYYDGGDDDDVVIDDTEYAEERGRLHSLPPPPPRPKLPGPTAASTAAAFRIKAEVTLKAAGSKTKVAMAKAAGAAKAKVRDRMAKPEDVRRQAEGVRNDYDFEDYQKKASDEDERQDDLEYGVEDPRHRRRQQQQQQQQPNDVQNGDDEGGSIYGMHILDRDRTLDRRLPKRDRDDDEAVGLFNDLCDELGVTPDTHDGLRGHYFYRRPRSGRYKYPIFRTKKFRRMLAYGGAAALSLLIISSVISAATKGYEGARKKKAPPLPDWEAEEDWRAKQKLEWEKGHPQDAATGGDVGGGEGDLPQSRPPAGKEVLFETVSAAYRPVWYDRSTGWTGTSYAEALSFCLSRDGHVPCPYEVYCPDEKTLLAGEAMDEDADESWAAVVNDYDEWVQVGSGGRACELYSTLYGRRPHWGSPDEAEGATGHIMCCRAKPLEAGEADGGDKHEVVRPGGASGGSDTDVEIVMLSNSKKYKPTWFDRGSGWEGRTYEESLRFCAGRGGFPCPYDVYCPGGRGKLLNGVRDTRESWAAVIDVVNDWVQVSKDGECNLYSETEKELPSWGKTGENSEEITQYIMCCQGDPPHGAETTSDVVVDIASPPLVTMPEPSHALTKLEAKVLDAHNPMWFNSKSGWTGTTYAHARDFCESISLGDATLNLCALSDYCPNGPQDDEPLYLQMNAFNGVQWAPISNEENGWIMVGKFSNDRPMTCQTHLDINHQEPDWGLDGSSPELKEHILCCIDETDGEDSGVMKGDGGQDQVDSASVSEQAEIPENAEDSTASAPNNGAYNGDKPYSMTESEKEIEDAHHPLWFSRKFGWEGTRHDDARAFCESIPREDTDDTLHLCPRSAYCPNGPRDSGPLFLQVDAFEGVQWAPINEGNGWIMIGDVAGLTCQTYEQINHRDPVWGLDGSATQLKEHILCCEDNSDSDGGTAKDDAIPLSGSGGEGGKLTKPIVGLQQGAQNVVGNDYFSTGGEDDSVADAAQVGKQALTNSLTSTFSPMWFDLDQGGWNGGSHDDGIRFCEQFAGAHGKRMELCPYAAYCPNGPSKPVIGGHMADFNEEGEQWSPVYGQGNHWVMIGKKGHNSATTCLSHVQLTGVEPPWGLDSSNTELKRHVMCCSPLQ